MELFHTSPAKINKINGNGRFGEFLFFAPDVYVMTAGEFLTYRLELDDDGIIDAGSIFYQYNAEILAPLVAKIAQRYGVDDDVAESLLDESKNIFNVECNVEPEDLADASWDIQKTTAQAAKLLGFRGVKVSDEQGSAYMIDMAGRESELQIAE